MAKNGILNYLFVALNESVHLAEIIQWDRLGVDVFFSEGKGGGELADYGH